MTWELSRKTWGLSRMTWELPRFDRLDTVVEPCLPFDKGFLSEMSC